MQQLGGPPVHLPFSYTALMFYVKEYTLIIGAKVFYVKSLPKRKRGILL